MTIHTVPINESDRGVTVQVFLRPHIIEIARFIERESRDVEGVGFVVNFYEGAVEISRIGWSSELAAEVKAELSNEYNYYNHPVFDFDEVRQPDFATAKRPDARNWRNHVPDAYIARWEQLSEQTRIAIYVMAKLQSANEEWD